jgi:hypothetical protein
MQVLRHHNGEECHCSRGFTTSWPIPVSTIGGMQIPRGNFRVSMEWEADTWQDVEGEMLHGANSRALYIV